MLADSLASQISSLSFDASQQKWVTDRAAALLVSAISKGAKLKFDDGLYPRVDLGFRTNATTGFRQPETLFEQSKTLMASMVKLASSSGVSAETFVRALTTSGTRGEIFGLGVVLNSASLTGDLLPVISTLTM
ncbi:hypothetical protein R8510_05205 [Ralstonia chuxiongensis]|nr:hypothetical protein R8510_05205 [Ralstonia chuxiongensis]